MATAPDHLANLPHMEIRAMTDGDVRAVVEIERASYQFPWSEGIFRDCLRVGYACRVVLSEAELIGYGIMSTGAGEAHILNVCVRESFRCRGIGRTLLEHLLSRAGAGGSSEAYLEVRPSNTAAIRLYQALGFEPIGVRRGYYQAVGGREDAAVLRLPLRARRAHQT
ncbi:MAG TPA: ribosomal protein S18-alanine N-acetyltransferase [Steroidobacteraceae bacterium]|nr:ribosomal protein S18-alanine N-acetyltransferase [Steroidobacteraceae bacterium]